MAIPDDKLSSLVIADHFLSPDDLETFALLDYELGGKGLNDTSEGMRYQTWTARYYPSTGNFVLSAGTVPPTIVYNAADVTEFSFTFDQNMQPFITYVEAGVAKFWWWDTNIAGYTVSNLPAGSLTPKCCLDDKRESQTTSSDVILCYVHSGALKERKQRDRFEDEFILDDPFLHPKFDLPAILKKIGMNSVNRLQWLCDLADPLGVDWCGYINDGN